MAAAAAASDAAAAEARSAVATLRAPGATHLARAAATQRLLELLNAARSEDASAAAHAALDADALAPLTVAVREAARNAGQGVPDPDNSWLCACFAIGKLCHCAWSPGVDAPKWHAAGDALVDALLACGARSAIEAFCVCNSLCLVFVAGVFPRDEAAATAGRGVAVTLKAHVASQQPLVACDAAVLLHTILLDQPAWPADLRKSTAVAFCAAGGVEAILSALDAHREDDKTTHELLSVLPAALEAAPRERLACLGAAESYFATLTRVLQRTSLSLQAREFAAVAALCVAETDAAGFAKMANVGFLDAAVACLRWCDFPKIAIVCSRLLALAIKNKSAPADVAAAIPVLTREATVQCGSEYAMYCCAVLGGLCQQPGNAQVIIDMDVPAAMLAMLAACGGSGLPRSCMCNPSLYVLAHVFGSCADRAVLNMARAGALRAALRALQLHLHDVEVASLACCVLERISKVCQVDTTEAIGATDGWRTLVAALHEHGAAKVDLANCVFAVLGVAAKLQAPCMAAAAAGAVSAITAVMRAQYSDPILQVNGVMVLGIFARSGELVDTMIAARASAAVAAAMARHSTAVEMQRAGCIALDKLCGLESASDGKGRRRGASAAVAAGAPAAVLAAWRMHAGDEELTYCVPRVLSSLLTADVSSWPPDGASRSETRDALVACIAANGCPTTGGRKDTNTLYLAIRSLAPLFDPQGLAPPTAAEALCVALRVAADMRAEGLDAARDHTCAVLTLQASDVIAARAEAPGAAGATFSAAVLAAGAVEQLAAAAAHAALPGGGPTMYETSPCASTLWAITELTTRSPAAACRAAACGAHTLVDACKSASAFAGMQARCGDYAAMARRLRALATAHKKDGDCAVPDCALLLMNRRRCCLRDCAAVAADKVALKLCSACRCAAFCSQEHQRQAWPHHKAVCKARAAVEAACTRLQAPAAAAGAASGVNDA